MNTLNLLNELKETKKYTEIRSILYNEYDIKSVEAKVLNESGNNEVDNDENSEKTEDEIWRIILSSKRNTSMMNKPVHQECNGLVIEHNMTKNTYKILCYPVKLPNIQHYAYIGDNLKKKFNNYEIYKIYDGTIINMYWYGNSWRFSTCHGYDVTDQIFYDQTYKEIFDMIVNIKYNKNENKFSYDLLDKKQSYTFCFKYTNYHIFNPYYNTYKTKKGYVEELSNQNELNDIVFLQSCNLDELNNNGNVVLNKDYNLPFKQEEKETRISNINNIIEICKTEYDVYLNYKNNKNKNSKIYYPIYGFLLKEKNIKNGKNENIIIYTNLYDYIKKNLYIKSFKNQNLKKYNNYIEITLLHKFLLKIKTRDNNILQNLFPQYLSMFSFLKKFIYDKLPVIILHNLNNLKKYKDNLNAFTNEQFILDDVYKNVSNDLLHLCIKIYLNNQARFDFNPKDDNIYDHKSILQDFILSENYVLDYYNLYQKFNTF